MLEPTRRRFLIGLAAAGSAAGCQGVPTIFGYHLGADALYDPNIRSVYVHTFNNRAFQTTPYRGFEVDVTQEVVRQIGAKTPFRVVSDPMRADTELLGNIVAIQKNLGLRTQQNTVRDGELVVTVDVLWRDLRDGTILSAPRKGKPGSPIGPVAGDQPVPFDPNLPPPPPVVEIQNALPQRIVAGGRYLMELGETNASAEQRVQLQIATQIVSMMEKRWW